MSREKTKKGTLTPLYSMRKTRRELQEESSQRRFSILKIFEMQALPLLFEKN